MRANIQAPAVGRGQRAIHNVAGAVWRLLRLHHVILTGVSYQRVRQQFPVSNSETEAQKKRRLASTHGMRRI